MKIQTLQIMLPHILYVRDRKYFSHLIENANIISNNQKLIEGSKRITILLPQWTTFIIDDALFSSKSRKKLLRFKDIR